MAFNFKLVLSLAGICLSILNSRADDRLTYSVASVELKEIKNDDDKNPDREFFYNSNLKLGNDFTIQIPNPDPIEQSRKVISAGRDLVALGEDVYRLVVKGKPTNNTKYAPISVVPKENGEPVDIMATENWSMPVKRTFQVVYKNLYGIKVVVFRYSVLYSYAGSYNDKGAYLTSVQIIPEFVRTLFGYDFTATMKLGGIQNSGTRKNPVAGATLLIEYTVNTILEAMTTVGTVYVTGRGGFKHY